MPRLLISGVGGRQQVYTLREGDHVIGREGDAQIVLPNVSVSRHHAKITVSGAAAIIEDLGSGNGTSVNGNVILQARLNSKDEVKIGKFTLIFLTDTRADEFYKGRSVRYMPEYSPRAGEVSHEATFVLTKDALKAMANQSRLVEQARLVLVRDPTKFWHPEDRPLSFGDSSALVGVNGWFIWGKVAEVTWDGSKHTLRRLAWWVPVRVNDQATSEAPLRHNDRVSIGDSSFRYEGEAR